MKSSRRSVFAAALGIGIGLVFGVGCESVNTRSMKIYMQQQNWAKALEQGRAAVAENPNDAEAWFALAQVAAQVDSFNLMLRSMERADALSDKHDQEIAVIREAKYNQVFNGAVQKYNAADIAAAHERLDLAIRINPKRANAYKVLGMIHQRNNEIPVALEFYQKAYDADTSDIAVGRTLANLYATAGQRGRALALMERLYASHPGDKEVALSYVMMLESANRVDSAITVAKEIIAREPDNAAMNMRIGVLYMKKAQAVEDTATYRAFFRQAVPFFEHVLTVDSSNTDAAYNLAICFQQMGHPDEAVRPLTQVVGNNPTDNQARLQLATVLLQQDSVDVAEPHLQTIVRNIGEPTNAQDRETVAKAYRFLQIIYTHRGNTTGMQAQQLREGRANREKIRQAEALETESRDLLRQAQEYQRQFEAYSGS